MTARSAHSQTHHARISSKEVSEQNFLRIEREERLDRK